MTANPGEIRPLLTSLTDVGVILPPGTSAAREAIAVLEDATRFPYGIPEGLSTMSAEQLVAEVDRVTFGRSLDMARKDTRGHFIQALADTIAADLADHTDDILDQLRPAFDKATQPVIAAHKAGVRADHDAGDILKLEPKAVTIWRQMSDAVSTLDDIANVRLRLARALGQPPAPGQESGAFCATAGVWNGHWSNRWLALVDHGLKLNSGAETRQACIRPRRAPIAPSNATLDTTPESSGRWVSIR